MFGRTLHEPAAETKLLFCAPLRYYRAEKKSLQILLSRTQAGPGRKVKQEQEEISRNHVQTFIYPAVLFN